MSCDVYGSENASSQMQVEHIQVRTGESMCCSNLEQRYQNSLGPIFGVDEGVVMDGLTVVGAIGNNSAVV